MPPQLDAPYIDPATGKPCVIVPAVLRAYLAQQEYRRTAPPLKMKAKAWRSRRARKGGK